ncbi:lanthionine synthetase LanC family protein [Kitasatospora sp. NPDC006697]|uniref:lanthionine synthetase LanC family protein n=1 Tax=Kitasatospora sp. NPDC006697 TaxID=3364020 RepID=UPI00367C8999
MTSAPAARAEECAAGALDWLLHTALATPDGGLSWPTRPSEPEFNPVLYSGTAGVALAMLEGLRHFDDERYAEAALRGARSVATAVDEGWEISSLYFGLAGMAFALHTVDRQLGDRACGAAARRALDRVRSRFDGTRWAPQFELLSGNAGIALAALEIGDSELALLAVEPYLRAAESTPHGVSWMSRVDRPARLHHLSHGTLGVAYALASVGRATGRADLLELALAGTADVVARNEAGPTGFLVPHSDPQDRPDRIERYSYGWCHGPAGDAQAFRHLHALTGDPAWTALGERCWHTVTRSGLPNRLRPGFWDNNGRCCGTAGVLALACDRLAERGDPPGFADTLAGDLLARATADRTGVRWSNTEHRRTPSALEPLTGWAMGNAGIARELLRYARIRGGGEPGYAVDWPDHQPVAVSAARPSAPSRPASP